MSGFSSSPPWRASVTHGGYPCSLCTGNDVQPCSASTQVNSLSAAEAQLHLMLHVFRRQTPDNAAGHRRSAEITTMFRAEKKHKSRSLRIRAFLLSSHNKSMHFPKLSNAAGMSAATPTGTRSVTRSRSYAQESVGSAQRLVSSRRRKRTAHASRLLSSASGPCPVSTVIFQAHTSAGRRDNSGSPVELGGDTMAICGVVYFGKKEQFAENDAQQQ